MADYKQLNKELIDANRELKQLCATLQREVILMRSELLEHHRLRVEAEYNCREQILTTLTKNYLSTINSIDSKINVIELLGYKNTTNPNDDQEGAYAENSASSGRPAGRRSTQLVREFRRTSAVYRQQNVVHLSPTRRVHSDDNSITPPVLKEVSNEAVSTTAATRANDDAGSDMDLDNSINSDNVIDVDEDGDDDDADKDKGDEEGERVEENVAAGGEYADLRCIVEASDEDESESEYECEEEDIRDSTVLRKQNALRDLSNRCNTRANNAHNKKAGAITRGGKQRCEDANESENSIQIARDQEFGGRPTQYVMDMEVEVEDDLVNSMRNSLHVSRKTFNITEIEDLDKDRENLCDKEKPKKHLVVRVQRLHNQPQIVVNHADGENTIIHDGGESTCEERRTEELTLGITHFSLDVSSSTPFRSIVSKKASKKSAEAAAAAATAVTETALTDDEQNANSLNSSEARPSRRCTPKSLAEPSLKGKLRSEGGKRRNRSKKR